MSNSFGGQQLDVARGFEKVLNSHGFGFHYSVIKRAKELFDAQQSPWDFDAAEVPVEVRGVGTRIDLVLKRSSPHPDNPDYYLIAECKRANPALSNWCFIQAANVRPNYRNGILLWEQVYHELATLDPTAIYLPVRPSVYIQSAGSRHQAYHVALDL